MRPPYFNENAFSIYFDNRSSDSLSSKYEVETPETKFERELFELFQKGKEYLFKERPSLALNVFKELSLLFLRTIYPSLQSSPDINPFLRIPSDHRLFDLLMAKAGELLKMHPGRYHAFPAKMMQSQELPEEIEILLDSVNNNHYFFTRKQRDGLVIRAKEKAKSNDFEEAERLFERAYKVFQKDHNNSFLAKCIFHDLVVLKEKKLPADDKVSRKELLKTFDRPYDADPDRKDYNAYYHGWLTLIGLQLRAEEGDPELEMEKIKTKYESIDRKLLRVPSHEVRKAIKKSSLSLVDDSLIHKPKLLTVEYDLGEKGASIQDREEVFFQISGEDEDLDIIISDDISFELKKYFRKRSKSKDLGILSSYSNSSTHFLVHLPHVYFFILPMAIVDCEISFGKLDKAAEMLEEIIDYKFLNEEVEAVKIWMRLADIYLDLGDREYKQAGGDEEQYGEAAAYYEKLVKADGSLDDNSPLYKNARLAKIKKRVADFLNSDKPENSDDNPAILSRILEAKIKLTQIEHKLNYFGINEGYILPFSFEYLQNTARYFAQQASQLEQQYIQFKSTAENEELQYDRMDQQVALAEQTTLLEWRGFEEAMEGVRVAHKNESYANVQVWNAASTLQFFKAKKDELLEISEIEAWANASIGDQPRLRVENTSLGYIRPKLILKKGQWKNYWDEEVLERDDMIRILAHHRVSISHQFEQNKLENEELSSMAYREVTKAQLVQAIARQKVAQQRVTVANLQHRHAYENRQFLDLKEFGAGNWYEMSRQSRRLAQKYLDMATEISLLMEYAYNAETERGLKMIKHDYAATYNPKQLNSQQLLHDIDSFTYDMITNVRSKKSQVVKTISLADKHPTSFYNFKESGAIQFQTTLSGFEREFPGLYLCKIRNVEVSFTGVFHRPLFQGHSEVMGSLLSGLKMGKLFQGCIHLM
jgi:hypothetical protein